MAAVSVLFTPVSVLLRAVSVLFTPVSVLLMPSGQGIERHEPSRLKHKNAVVAVAAETYRSDTCRGYTTLPTS